MEKKYHEILDSASESRYTFDYAINAAANIANTYERMFP
jgi:hypothetical protein